MPSSPPNAAPGVAASLGARARPVLDLIDGLRALGLQRDIPIPQVAVMGDQSSGKSSVLEAISGIAFPHGSGLVTRCATQISMGDGEVWSAEIRAGSGGKAVTIESPGDVTAKIKEMTAELCGEEGFCSEEVIEINLRAPELPDLTIIDLPGIVRTATKDQSEAVIGQVDDLLEKYLSQERTVILAVIPAASDIATVDVIERAAKVDPDGNRTMAVLTKPDLVDAGGEREVMSVLDNITKPLQHGYFMLRNRSQKESDDGVSLEDARARERAWFKKSKYAARGDALGVEALTSALTTLLVGHIESALPVLRKEVKVMLAEAEGELSRLGEAAPENAGTCRMVLSEIMRKWMSSMRRVCAQADYGELEDSFSENEENDDSSSENGEVDVSLSDFLYNEEEDSMGGEDEYLFCKKKRNSLFVLRVEGTMRTQFVEKVKTSKPGFDGEGDRFDTVVTETATKTTNSSHKEVGYKCKKQLWSQCQSVTKVGKVLSFDYAIYGYTKSKITKISPYFRGDLKKQIRLNRGRELPGFMNFGVFKSLMASYISRWEPDAEQLRSSVAGSVRQAGLYFFDSHFRGHVRATGLRLFLSRVFHAHLKEIDSKACGRMKHLLKQEIEIPMTMNHYLWDTINKIRDERMLKKLESLEKDDEGKWSKSAVIAALKSDIGNDSNESQEVNDMLDMLKAYWKLAMKRYVDGICATVTSSYTSDASLEAMAKMLDKELAGLDDVKVHALFEEPSAILSKRCGLEKKIERLTQASQRLDEF